MAGATVRCPKCGFKQAEDFECQRCGIVFSRYGQGSSRHHALSFLPDAVPVVVEPGFIARLFQFLKWGAVFGAVACVILALSSEATPPSLHFDTASAQRVTSKIERFGNGSTRDAAVRVELDEAETNAWLRPSLMMAMNSTHYSLKDVRVELIENGLRTYVLFNYFGAAMMLLVEGDLSVVDHHLRFSPVNGKLGSLPLPQNILNNMTHRAFHNIPLSPAITGVAVHRGVLTVSF